MLLKYENHFLYCVVDPMKNWYWYISRPNEMLLDLDSGRAVTRALSVLRRALNVRQNQQTPLNRLDIESVWLYRSSKDHYHLLIVLKSPVDFYIRAAWALWMGADQIRAAYVMERYRRRFKINKRWWQYQREAELIAARKIYHRPPDAVCQCKDKHKRKSVTDHCPALKKLLGHMRSDDYFPRNRDKRKRKPVRFEWGQVPLNLIKEWRSNAKTKRR